MESEEDRLSATYTKFFSINNLEFSEANSIFKRIMIIFGELIK